MHNYPLDATNLAACSIPINWQQQMARHLNEFQTMAHLNVFDDCGWQLTCQHAAITESSNALVIHVSIHRNIN